MQLGGGRVPLVWIFGDRKMRDLMWVRSRKLEREEKGITYWRGAGRSRYQTTGASSDSPSRSQKRQDTWPFLCHKGSSSPSPCASLASSLLSPGHPAPAPRAFLLSPRHRPCLWPLLCTAPVSDSLPHVAIGSHPPATGLCPDVTVTACVT